MRGPKGPLSCWGLTVSLPQDTNPPSVPVLTVTDVGPTHVSMSWSSTDEGSVIYYWVYRSDWGNWAYFRDTAATSGMVNGLSPNKTYAFQAQARDKLRTDPDAYSARGRGVESA